jgi:molybdopterin-guanine dinucleotide biosynthesis protein
MLSKLSDLSDVVLEGYDDDDDDVVLREEREGKRKQLQQQQQHGFTTLEEELSDGGGTIEMRLLLNGFGIIFTLFVYKL